MTETFTPPTPPCWVRFVDLACLVILLLALLVATSGGFRLHFGAWRIALTSPYRLFAVVAVLAVVRHWAAPSMPIYRDFPRRVAAWWTKPGVSSAATVVIGTRPAMLLVGYIAIFLIGYPERPPLRFSQNELINLPVRWDAGWYFRIATDGYSFDGHRTDVQQTIVFFPAYPMLVRVAGRLLGGWVASYSLGGVLASILAFFGGLMYVYALARDSLDADQADCALWLIAAYPFALFYGTLYGESLFLLGTAGAFYHMTRRQYWVAAAWGLLVGLTRPNGFFLSIPLAVIALSPLLPAWLIGGPRATPNRSVSSSSQRWLPALVAVGTPALGLLIHSTYLWWLTGNPLVWLAGQIAWARTYQGVTSLVVDRYNLIRDAGFAGYMAILPVDLMNGLAVIFVLVAAWPVARRIGLAYGFFIVINIVPPLLAGGLLSIGRFSSVLFPAFVWLASILPRGHRTGWIATFVAIQALNATAFYTWRTLL